MNPFSNFLIPPNMDVVCNSTTTQTTVLGITTTNNNQVCSDPWNYYKGYGFDIVIILIGIWIVTKIIIEGVNNIAH